MTKYTKGSWTIEREKINRLPAIHVMSGETFLCSVHETTEKGEDLANANLFKAAKDMYEAICTGLSGLGSDGKPVSKQDAVKNLIAAKEKAEGKGI